MRNQDRILVESPYILGLISVLFENLEIWYRRSISFIFNYLQLQEKMWAVLPCLSRIWSRSLYPFFFTWIFTPSARRRDSSIWKYLLSPINVGLKFSGHILRSEESSGVEIERKMVWFAAKSGRFRFCHSSLGFPSLWWRDNARASNQSASRIYTALLFAKRHDALDRTLMFQYKPLIARVFLKIKPETKKRKEGV